MAEFEWNEIARLMGSDLTSAEKILGFQQNSALIRTGELFFALRGERVDGHQFLDDAKERGAVGAVISKDYTGERHGLACIEVDDVLEALHALAKEIQARRKTRIVAVTGSVGKTTTKEFIATLLEGKFRVAKTPGNANSQVGVPLSILNATGDEEIFVMEMGMSAPQELSRLVDIAPPEVAMITKIALAHALYFPDGLEAIAAAKSEILLHPKTQLAVINHQVLEFQALHCHKNALTYSLEADQCDSHAILIQKEGKHHIKKDGVASSEFSLPFAASHLCENFLGAALIAHAMGMEWDEIFVQAEKLRPYKNRFELVERNGILFLNDSYNANPTSMKAALRNMPRPRFGGRTIAVLGAMKELGSFCEVSHGQVAEVALQHIDHLICLGLECFPMVEVFEKNRRSVELFENLSDVKKRVADFATPGDVVLLKGSNSNRLWEVLEYNP